MDDVRQVTEGLNIVDYGGLSHRPATCGKGGLALGLARFPSMELIKAVSSPQI